MRSIAVCGANQHFQCRGWNPGVGASGVAFGSRSESHLAGTTSSRRSRSDRFYRSRTGVFVTPLLDWSIGVRWYWLGFFGRNGYLHDGPAPGQDALESRVGQPDIVHEAWYASTTLAAWIAVKVLVRQPYPRDHELIGSQSHRSFKALLGSNRDDVILIYTVSANPQSTDKLTMA